MNDFFLKVKILAEFWRIISRGKSIGDFILARPVQEFEKRFAEYCGTKYALGVASGTDALILSLKALDIGHGDEVIVPSVSFFSTAGAVAWVGARPVFVDVDLQTYNIDASKIEGAITTKTKAIIPAHLNGRTADMDQIMQIARQKSLKVIADASHAAGSKYKNCPIGALGDIACLSLNVTKTLGGYGDGGVVLTNNLELAEKIKRLRTYGALYWKDIHSRNELIGVASRLDVFQASALNEKLFFLDSFIRQQRKNYYFYQDALRGIAGLAFPEEHSDYFINGYRLPVLTAQRDELLNFLAERGEMLYNWYPVPLPYLPAFHNLGYKKGDFPAAEKIAQECLILPTIHSLPEAKIKRITNLIKHYFVSHD